MAEKYTPPESFVNPHWPHDPRHDARDGSLLAFSHETLLAYFRESPFYDKSCVNEMCRVQALPVNIILECVRRACGLICLPMCLVHCVRARARARARVCVSVCVFDGSALSRSPPGRGQHCQCLAVGPKPCHVCSRRPRRSAPPHETASMKLTAQYPWFSWTLRDCNPVLPNQPDK